MTPARGPTALVAEDEPALRDELCAHLEALWPGLRIVARVANGLDALRLMALHEPDVLFLDIQMPGLTGLEVAQQARGSHVVFVTAYDAHAVAAFERGALDYVLKPYDAARLALAVTRIRDRLGQTPVHALEAALRELAAQRPQREYLQWINAAAGQEVRLITVDEVCYFQSDTKYTRVVTAEGEALIRRSLKELADQLDPARFWAVHRSTIVNANAVAGIVRDLRGGIRLRLKQRSEWLPVSESHAHLFRQM